MTEKKTQRQFTADEHAEAERTMTTVDGCKHCGERISWRADGLVFGDGSVAHIRCYEAHENKRQKLFRATRTAAKSREERGL